MIKDKWPSKVFSKSILLSPYFWLCYTNKDFFVISFFFLNAQKHSEEKCSTRTLLWMEEKISLKNTGVYPS